MDDKGKKELNTKITDLSNDLISDILSRLPMKTLFNCMLVSKTWLPLFSEPFFVNLQRPRSPTSILINTFNTESISWEPHSVQIVDNVTGSPNHFEVETMKFVPKVNLPTSDFELMNSCNGLLCLSEGRFHDVIGVCNPVLGQHMTIPVDNNKASRFNKYFALGFSAATNRYKVIRTFYSKVKPLDPKCKAEIYTIGTRQWRSIENAFSIGRLDFNTSLRGCIHWVLDHERTLEFICSFDFEREEFRQMTLPFTYDRIFEFLKLRVSKGCLCVIVERLGTCAQFDIWVMKEYGVKESWIKQYVIENLYPDNYGYYEPLIFLSNGNIMMSLNGIHLVCYDTKRKRFDENTVCLSLTHGFHIHRAIAYNPSFVSLYKVAEGEQVKALRTNVCLSEIAEFPMGGSQDQAEEDD